MLLWTFNLLFETLATISLSIWLCNIVDVTDKKEKHVKSLLKPVCTDHHPADWSLKAQWSERLKNQCFVSLSLASGHVDHIRSGAWLHHHIMHHLSKLQPQRALRLHSHRDGLSDGRLRQVLPSEGLSRPSHTAGEESFRLHLQLKVQHVSSFPALWDVSVQQEISGQPETIAGMKPNLLQMTPLTLTELKQFGCL